VEKKERKSYSIV